MKKIMNLFKLKKEDKPDTDNTDDFFKTIWKKNPEFKEGVTLTLKMLSDYDNNRK